MVKSIIKEIIIMLLLVVAVLLALGIVFYNELPNTKTIPSVTKYSTAESIKNDISEVANTERTTYASYTITSGDLKNYSKTNVYVERKDNPFTPYVNTAESAETTGNSVSGTNTQKNNTVKNSTK